MSGGGRCPKLADIRGANVQVAGVLRGQKSGGTSPGGKSPGGKCPRTEMDQSSAMHNQSVENAGVAFATGANERNYFFEKQPVSRTIPNELGKGLAISETN